MTAGLGAAGWITGVICALIVAVARGPGLRRHGAGAFGPASWVTLARAALAVGVAALAVDARDSALLVALAAAALALDAVDGRVARRTGTVSAFGARFDGEVDAFLILALSVAVAPAYGAWVLAIGDRPLRLPRRRVAAAVDARRRCRRDAGARSWRRRRASC